jgi:hypothetical protein
MKEDVEGYSIEKWSLSHHRMQYRLFEYDLIFDNFYLWYTLHIFAGGEKRVLQVGGSTLRPCGFENPTGDQHDTVWRAPPLFMPVDVPIKFNAAGPLKPASIKQICSEFLRPPIKIFADSESKHEHGRP